MDPKVITGSFDDIPIVALALSSSDDSTTLTSKVNQILVKLAGGGAEPARPRPPQGPGAPAGPPR